MRVLFVIALTSLLSALTEGQFRGEADTRAGPTRTPGGEPASQLDEGPILADEATTRNVDEAEQEAELCSRCYDSVRQASELAAFYEHLLKKQRRLINRKKAAADAAKAAASRSNEDAIEPGPRSPKNTRSAPTTTTTIKPKANSTGLRVKMLEPGEIVVARLRVARSPTTGYSKLAGYKDLELEKLKREQQNKKEEICNALQKARDCLAPIERQCLGDLNFHINELFVDQSFQQYRCPFPNSHIKPLHIKPTFTRRLEDPLPAPLARPISSDQAVRERMDQLLPGGKRTRLGVVLEPRLQPRLAQPHYQPKISMSWLPIVLGCGLAIFFLLIAIASQMNADVPRDNNWICSSLRR